MIRIKSIWIEWLVDDTPDVSWLDRTAQDHYGKNGRNWDHVSEESIARTIEKFGSVWEACEHYARKDQERLAGFHAGEWYMMGCIAKATVLYSWGNSGAYRLEHLASSGLWGIESDSSSGYLAEVETEELADLKAHLEKFKVNTADFDEIYEEGRDG
jgi:hypothetical protein